MRRASKFPELEILVFNIYMQDKNGNRVTELLGKMESQNVDSLPARIYNIFVTVQYLNSHAQKSIKEKTPEWKGKQIDEENYFNRRSSYRTLTCRTLCWLSERESETSELRQVR